MIRTELHCHTVYCDGKNTPEEMVLAAIGKGFRRLGFSGHSETLFDLSYCMTAEKTAAYQKEVARLKKKYADRLAIFLGVEQDYYSAAPTDQPATPAREAALRTKYGRAKRNTRSLSKCSWSR